MSSLTNHFDLDKKTTIIQCNAKTVGKRGYRRKVVLISKSKSNWTTTYKSEVDENVSFRTEFRLFRSEKHYLLQISGISDKPNDFPAKYKVVLFVEPSECLEIILDEKNHDLYMSDPILSLLEGVFDSEYLTSVEKEKWDEVVFDSEE